MCVIGLCSSPIGDPSMHVPVETVENISIKVRIIILECNYHFAPTCPYVPSLHCPAVVPGDQDALIVVVSKQRTDPRVVLNHHVRSRSACSDVKLQPNMK